MTFPCQSYHVAVEDLADGVAIHLVGRLHPEESNLVDRGILERVGHSQSHLYVDCGELKTIGSSGMAGLVQISRVASGWGGRAVLFRVPPEIREIIEMTKVDRILDIRKEAVPGSKLRWTDPSWLSWNDGAVYRIAQDIYDTRTFDHLPILADALEDAGCTNVDILSHCRGPGPHVRRCWAINLILGKS